MVTFLEQLTKYDFYRLDFSKIYENHTYILINVPYGKILGRLRQLIAGTRMGA